MTHRSRLLTRAIFSIAALVTSSAVLVPAQEPKDKAIADMAGEWQVSYTNGSIRVYAIDGQGLVTFKSEQESRKGRVFRKSEAILLMFGGDPKVERLTMGTDGRLFVEHFQQQADLLGKKLEIMGIGIRQK
jgi:hypothetical protein